jgi:RNA polymerase sigma-70 factor, ECF subfamily
MSITNLTLDDKSPTIMQNQAELEPSETVESFEAYRSYLFAIAYRMLGSAMDAEDMVQETFLRWQAAAPETINSPKAYLTTILTRLCIDQLHLAYKQRETYLGPWLPEPILTAGADTPNIEEAAVMQESLSLAFLSLLEQLQPLERAVFLLREVFDYDYADIATFTGRKEAACRQLFSRARRRLAESQPRHAAPPEVHRRLLAGFLQAVQSGDQAALMDLLAEDARLVADGGGKVPGAATQPILGREAVMLFALGASRRFLPPGRSLELSEVNHRPACIVRAEGRAVLVLALEVEDGQVKTVCILANPDKLSRLGS